MSGIRKRRALGLAFVLPMIAGLGAARTPSVPPLQRQAEAIVSEVSGDWGVMAWSADEHKLLVAINAGDTFAPASNNKVFTTIWALHVLGPDYRFPTDLLITGPIENGVLHGDVVLRGSGDPAFGYPQFNDDPMAPLRLMAQQLRARGVTSIDGRVVADPFIFDTVLVGPEWPRDTGGGSAQYAPGVSGLAFHRNLIWIEARPNPSGGAALIELTPSVPDVVPVVSSVRSGGNRAWAIRGAGRETIQVKGGVSGRAAHVYRVGVAHPARMAAGALRQAILEAGIQVPGGVAVGHTPADAKLIHRHYSIPLAVMIQKMNTESDNFFAEHIWKATVARVLGKGSYARGGPASARFFHEHTGVPFGQLYQFDGSGLSQYDRISPNAMVRALLFADQSSFSKIFHESLPVGGDPRGTLHDLFRRGPARGNLHAKTGYINDVRTLSGYVTAKNGELIVFSFLYNGRGTWPARTVQTELGDLLANYDGSP